MTLVSGEVKTTFETSRKEVNMPLYEYECESCGESFELIRSASDKDEVKCPACEAPAKKKLSLFATGTSGRRTCSPGSGGSFGGG
jgi:putative FmdB family regulatory protein